MNAHLKITILSRSQNADHLKQYAETIWDPCERLLEGQEFISEGANIPAGFCSWACGRSGSGRAVAKSSASWPGSVVLQGA
jgi:uncharacterized repeat protein (TIGR04076 family)